MHATITNSAKAGPHACAKLIASRSFLIILSGILNASRGWEELLHYSFVESSFQGMWSLGFGSTNSREMVDWKQPIKVSGVPISGVYPPAKAALLNAFKDTAGLFVNVLMGNIWQILLSLAYVLHNALLSGMLVGDEWAGFATERKPLRVSNPRGIQRSSYFISMPLRYGIPIMAFFSIEHWLLSQTIFLVRFIVSVSVNDGIQLEAFTTTGYSLPPAILGKLPFLPLAHTFFRLPFKRSSYLIAISSGDPQNPSLVNNCAQLTSPNLYPFLTNENSDYSLSPLHHWRSSPRLSPQVPVFPPRDAASIDLQRSHKLGLSPPRLRHRCLPVTGSVGRY